MRLIVTGGRDYHDKELVHKILDALKPIHLATGACPTGADHHAATWPARQSVVYYTPYPANWDQHGKAAGPMRNAHMIEDFKPDLLLAFPGGRGTISCIDEARKRGVPVLMVKP